MKFSDLVINNPGIEGFPELGALTGIAILFLVLAIIAFYVYHAFAWMKIAKKEKYKYPWFSWIPFLNIVQILEMGKFHWAWVFLMLVPIAGWIAIGVLVTIAMWKIFENQNYSGFLALSYPVSVFVGGIIIVYLVIIGIIAWKKPEKTKPKRKK